MGKKSWFTAVKKAITRESKENRDKSNRKRRGCFRRQRSVGLEAIQPTEEVKLLEAESEQNRQAYSVALVTAMAAEAAVAAANAAAEVVRLRAAAYTSGKPKEEVAAIKIQAAFRGYMARRVLRALRGLVRLKSVVGGKSAKRQAAESLKCMKTMARLQSEIRERRIRLLEETCTIQRLILHKNDEIEKPRPSLTQNGKNWDETTRSKEKIEATIHNRQEAAARRERALAYAYSNQVMNQSLHQQTRRATSESTDAMSVDPSSRGWGWSWLERWMAERPWEKVDTVEDGRLPNKQTPSTPKSKSRAGGKIRPPSPRGTDDDLRSLNSAQSEQCRRNSVVGSSVRDDESLGSSTAVPGYMAYTESARAKSRFPSPQGSETPVSVKKRLSFSGSPARPRRPSTPTRAGAGASP